MRRAWLLFVALTLAPLAAVVEPVVASNCAGSATGRVPLTDLAAGTYQGFEGGLYPGGSNLRPPVHEAAGLTLAQLTIPRNAAGAPDPGAGKLVLLSIGMSNTNQEFERFRQLALADPTRDPRVLLVNGAVGGWPASATTSPSSPYWELVDQRLAQAAATAPQVQAVWLKQANAGPSGGFPAATQAFEDDLRAILQILVTKFPNLHLVYLSSRIYAGYASTALNPEPYAYEAGFAVKWLIESQIDGSYAGQSPADGVVAPWLSWGPYLWADGLTPRSDGLVWACVDFAPDGTHPATSGREKVAQQLLGWVHSDPTARVWYEQGGGLPG